MAIPATTHLVVLLPLLLLPVFLPLLLLPVLHPTPPRAPGGVQPWAFYIMGGGWCLQGG